MSTWSEVRRLANARHRELAGPADAMAPAEALLAAAERATGVRRLSRPAGDPLLDGGEAAYDRELSRIYYSRVHEAPLANFYVAHEYGHHWLGEAAVCCAGEDLDASVPAEPALSPVGDADAYSPKERTEAQANLFAREFLLPRDKLRRRCESGAFDADTIAREVGVPVDLVMQQMADALLLPPERAAEERPRAEAPPDDSQREAIEAGPGPRQVRAGPGSGKTRTLVGRIAALVRAGHDPSSILALTYSNLSAQDLSARIRAAVGEPATAVWAGTFHAYGLELLRKYGHLIGYATPPKLLDRTDCLVLLEELLPELDLNHYLDLREPALKLRSILAAIGRAKDELATPDDYERHARAMLEAARDEKTTEAAERALEVARAYEVYERTLRARGWVDFGDLVVRPVELLRAHLDVRAAIHAQKPHVLVDEYQDMNRASSLLLREIVAPGRGPWVVGDVRQAIYRFRGASPLNMSRFGEDFPNAEVTDLSVNYRSGGAIVRTFETFGRQMAAGKLGPQAPLTPHHGAATGTVMYEVATTREAEADGLAETIKARVAAGGRPSDHAVLARSHTTLARIAARLERAGVPCLYFGDFFERPEVRDLLSLLSVVSEARGVGLLHVAQLPHYAAPPADIAKVVAWRRDQKVSMLSTLRRLGEVTGLSRAGRAALQRLADDVAFVDFPMPPHRFLMTYLFGGCDHLKRLIGCGGVAGQQQRLAVYQLLQFAFAFRPPEQGDPKRAFLDHIRRLELLDEEKQLRQMPAAARDIEAVRLMTVHASKGLEFPVVHIPALTTRHFPAPNRYEPCPAPAGLVCTDELMTGVAEEDSLFFVAMSRAQHELHLSRSLVAGGVSTKNPSRFLPPIAAHLPRALDAAATWTTEGPADPAPPPLAGAPADGEWTVHALETYLDCPRRYYYEYVLGLAGTEETSPYLQFQSALRASLAWMRKAASPAERTAGAAAQLDAHWDALGPKGHAYEALFRAMAERMVSNALTAMEGHGLDGELTVTLPGSGVVVRCRPDHVERTAEGIVVRRLKTGRLSKKKETDKPRYTLWQAGACQSHGVERVTFQHVSLLTGDSLPAETVAADSVQEQLHVLGGVVRDVGAGLFGPKQGQYCPTCPYYFVCPSHGETR